MEGKTGEWMQLIYCVMKTHRVFLHDIIADDCKHELPSKAQIQSINQTTGNKPLQQLYSIDVNRMGTTLASKQSFWQLSNEEDSIMRKSQYYHRWLSFHTIPNEIP
jgi:hypothetical protein